MRKFIFATVLATMLLPAAATLVPAAAMAQSYGEVRSDQQDVHRDVRRLRRAQSVGNYRQAEQLRRNLHDDKIERREDWQDYRRSHPEAYRGTAYAAPRPDWRYRPVAVGYRFDPVYYGDRYRVDPVRYRLPGERPGTRWVRYGNDVALVDVRSGRVLAVHGAFFG